MPSWKVRKNPFCLSAQQSVDPSFTVESLSDELIYAFDGMQNIEGEVVLWLPPGKTLEHNGIKIQFMGRIDLVCNNNQVNMSDSIILTRQ